MHMHMYACGNGNTLAVVSRSLCVETQRQNALHPHARDERV